MSLAKLTSKRQVTVPKPICDYLHVDGGDTLDFTIDQNGQVVVLPKTLDIKSLVGIVKTKKSASLPEMKQAIQKRMQKRCSKNEWH